jgi:endonuclease G
LRLFLILISFFLISCENNTKTNDYKEKNSGNTQEKIQEVKAKSIDYFSKYINNNCDQLIDKIYFEICYNYDLNLATAVGYKLEGDLVDELNIKDRPYFYAEPTLPQKEQIEPNNYQGTGYDRGHMAPDAAFDWSEDSLKATYSMANIVPQLAIVNREEWNRVEEHARKMAKKYNEITVVNLMAFDNNITKIGKTPVALPKGFYKIMYNIEKNYKECYYYANTQNQSKSLNKHLISCDNL